MACLRNREEASGELEPKREVRVGGRWGVDFRGLAGHSKDIDFPAVLTLRVEVWAPGPLFL